MVLFIPAQGSVSRNDVTLPSSTVVRLQDTQTLAGQAVHRQEARLTLTLGLLGPAVHHAAGELVAGQELAGIGPISCGRTGEETLVFMECVSPGGAEEGLVLMRSSAAGLH